MVATDTAHRHVETWMRRHFGEQHAFVTDVTSGYAQINVQGPRSRELLQSVTIDRPVERGVPVPRRRARSTSGSPACCASASPTSASSATSCTCPAEQAVHVYDRLVEAGAAFGLRHAGLKALASLRMEKGYRDYGHDIDNTDSVLEAGLGFAVDARQAGRLHRPRRRARARRRPGR